MARRLVALAVVLALCAGCASRMRDRQLENVAKDWSMVIRASQVIPVYPLTEDLQPGDIFLVQVPIDQQQRIYRERGFLPLDNLIHRLNPTGYPAFYGSSFGAPTPLPRAWLMPDGGGGAWSHAPTASFPTYAFSVRSGGGFNLALPVQGVPIGLSLMGGGAAQGTVTIADARTYGVDTASLYADVRTWAGEHREFLANFAPSDNRRNYVRVVSRVYLAGRLNVSLQSGRSFGLEASGGARKPVDLVLPSAGADPQQATLDAYRSNVGALNTMIEKGLERLLPGGTVKVVAASAGSVSLVETFPRPLIVGYLGFDLEIRQYGALGPPIPTHAVLDPDFKVTAQPSTEEQLLSTAALRRSYDMLSTRAKLGDTLASSLVGDLDRLERLVPDAYPCPIFWAQDAALAVRVEAGVSVPAGAGGFRRLLKYRSDLLDSIDELKKTQGTGARRVTGFDDRGPRTEAYLAEQLAAADRALRALNAGLRERALLVNQASQYANTIEIRE